jgi:hypothetical protein
LAAYSLQTFFKTGSPLGIQDAPDVRALETPSGRALVSVSVGTGQLLKAAPEICDFFLRDIDFQLGNDPRLPKRARYNLLSHYMPPSAGVLSEASRDSVYEALRASVDLRVELVEVNNKRAHTCDRALVGGQVRIRSYAADY